MKNRKKLMIVGLILVVVIGLVIGSYFTFKSPWKYRGDGPIKIFYLNSYHDYLWTEGQIEGFKRAFEIEGINIEVKQFNMDTKQRPSEDWESIARMAREEIEKWGPDLIYSTDDNAQRYVGEDFKGSGIPWVFSGVNAEAHEYGYDTAENVVGVLERDAYAEVFALAKSLYPHSEKVIYISDAGTTGQVSFDYFRGIAPTIKDYSDIEMILVNSFDEYKKVILDGQDFVDIFLIRGLNTFTDIDKAELIKWTIENSNVPEFSLNSEGVIDGWLAAVENSGISHGNLAGIMAKRILIDGENPHKIGNEIGGKGNTFINLARAKTLDLEIPRIILVNSEVVEEFPWEVET